MTGLKFPSVLANFLLILKVLDNSTHAALLQGMGPRQHVSKSKPGISLGENTQSAMTCWSFGNQFEEISAVLPSTLNLEPTSHMGKRDISSSLSGILVFWFSHLRLFSVGLVLLLQNCWELSFYQQNQPNFPSSTGHRAVLKNCE